MTSHGTSRRTAHGRNAVRIAFAFCALFLMNAAAIAWLPVWLEGRGLTGEAVGVVIATMMIARFIFAPAGGFVADALGRPRAVLVAAAGVMLLAFAALGASSTLLAFAAAAFLVGAGIGPSVPLLEANTVRLAQEGRGPGYGPMRAIGTAAFIVGTLSLGALVAARGEASVIVWLIATSAAYVLGAGLLPLPARALTTGAARPGVLRALAAPGLLLALSASALIQASHAFYYGFGSISWREQGLSDATIGALWAWGAGVEAVLLVFARRLESTGAVRLMMIGAACGVLRWVAMGFAPGLGWLVGLQALHAGTFAAAHLGFVLYVRDHAPPHAAATAQAVNSALTFGGVLAAATAASGVLYDHVGARGYWAMALLAGGGLGIALVLFRQGGASRNETPSR